MTHDGIVGKWGATGVGKFTNAQGAVSFQGAIYYQTPAGPLMALHQIAGVYAWEVDEHGKATGRVWAWQ